MVEKIKNVAGKEPEQVNLLGMKTTLISKTAVAAKKIARRSHKETAKPPAATTKQTTARKPFISFADQQKEHTWKWKLVLSWRIIVQHREKITTKEAQEAALGKKPKVFQ